MTRLLPLFALFLLGPLHHVGAQSTKPESQAAAALPVAPREPITVMTFNIRYGTAKDGENEWTARRAMLLLVIREQDPDVNRLQDLHQSVSTDTQTLPALAQAATETTVPTAVQSGAS